MHTPVSTRRCTECHIKWPVAFVVGTYLKTSHQAILGMEGKESFVHFTRPKSLKVTAQQTGPSVTAITIAPRTTIYKVKYKWSLEWQLLDLTAVISLYIKLKFRVFFFFSFIYFFINVLACLADTEQQIKRNLMYRSLLNVNISFYIYHQHLFILTSDKFFFFFFSWCC